MWTRYALALAIACMAIAVRWLLSEPLGERQSFTTVYLAVFIAALYLGVRPALVAMLVCVPAAHFFFNQPYGSLAVDDSGDTLELVVSSSFSLLIIAVVGGYRRANYALQRSHDQYQAFIRNSSEAIWRFELIKPFSIDLPIEEQVRLINERAYLAECNDMMARIYGYDSAKQMIGLPLKSIMQQDNTGNIQTIRDMVVHGYKLSDFETVDVDRDGKPMHMLNNIVGIVENGLCVRAWGTSRDITQRKLAEQNLMASNRRQLLLSDIASELLMHDQTQVMMDSIYKRLARHMNVEVFVHFLLDEEATELRLEAWGGLDEHQVSALRRLDLGQGACGLAALERRPVIFEQQSADVDQPWDLIKDLGLSAYICHPLLAHGRLIGTLSFGSRSKAKFQADEIALIRTVCDLAAAAVDRRRQQQHLQERMAQIQTINDLSDAVARADKLEDVYQIVLNSLQATLGADRAAVMLRDPSGTMRVAASRHIDQPLLEKIESHPKFQQLSAQRQPIIIKDTAASADPDDLRERLNEGSIRALAIFPLVYESQQLGCLAIFYDQSRKISTSQRRLAQTIANHVAVAIEGWIADQAILESHQQYRTLVEQVKDHAIFQIDPRGIIRSWNEGVQRVLGYQEDEFVGQSIQMLFPEEDIQDGVPQAELRRAATTGKSSNDRWMLRKGAVRFFASGTTNSLRSSNGTLIGFTKVMRDMTESRLAEEELARHREHLEELVHERTVQLEHSHQQLRHSERMAALGTLSAGLGHDMGNLLLPLRIRLDSLQSKVRPELMDDLRAIRTSAEYLQRLSNGLRLLAMDVNEADHSAERTDIDAWWADVQPILKNALPRGVDLQSSFQPDLPPVRIARHALTQAVFNLVQNAGDAMRQRGEGTVSIRASATAAKDGQPQVVNLAVIDNGPGMTPEVQRRCLEPFFTTRTRGISTGLGLALVHGVVQQAGGSIEIDSRVGEGSTFTLVLLAGARDGTQTSQGSLSNIVAAVSVDDTRNRQYVSSALRSLNFEVHPAPATEVPPSNAARVWVTDSDSHIVKRLKPFLQANPHNRTVVLGSAAELADHPQVIQVPEEPKPADIWRALREVASSDFRQADEIAENKIAESIHPQENRIRRQTNLESYEQGE